MADLKLNLVLGHHGGHFQALFDGSVKPEGIELDASRMAIDELFWRIPNVDDFDVAEVSLTGYMWGIQHGKRWTAIPVFSGWVFSCHTETLCNVDSGIEKPEDLRGKRVGVPEYPVTAIIWIRDAFETKYGVRPQDIHWHEERTVDYSHYRPQGYAPPDDVPVDVISREKRLCDMLIAGELDAVTRYFGGPEKVNSTHPGGRSHIPMRDLAEHPQIKWLYGDRKAAAIAYHQEIGFLQPIHCVMIKREIVDAHPWVPRSLYDAFARAAGMEAAGDYASATSFSLSREERQEMVGPDFSPVGLNSNLPPMTRILELCDRQGYIDRGRPFTVEEFFHESTLDT